VGPHCVLVNRTDFPCTFSPAPAIVLTSRRRLWGRLAADRLRQFYRVAGPRATPFADARRPSRMRDALRRRATLFVDARRSSRMRAVLCGCAPFFADARRSLRMRAVLRGCATPLADAPFPGFPNAFTTRYCSRSARSSYPRRRFLSFFLDVFYGADAFIAAPPLRMPSCAAISPHQPARSALTTARAVTPPKRPPDGHCEGLKSTW
jgi:hypothetical protein